MIKFGKKVLLLGYGAIGRSLHSLMVREVSFDAKNFYAMDADDAYIDMFVELGGLRENFIKHTITKDNYEQTFKKHLSEGDLLIDICSNAGTIGFIRWCAENNVMYLNSGDSDWADSTWRSLQEHYDDRLNLQADLQKANAKKRVSNKYPIVIQSGANPGMVSIFAKEALRYVVETQKSGDKTATDLLKAAQKDDSAGLTYGGGFSGHNNSWAKLAQHLKVRMVQVTDDDIQQAKIDNFDKDTLYNTWSPHTLFEEMMAPSEFSAGVHEIEADIPNVKSLDKAERFCLHNKRGIEVFCKSYSPAGNFVGNVIQHDEVTSIAKLLTVRESDKGGKVVLGEKPVYSPTVLFVYSPSDVATDFLYDTSRHNFDMPDKTHVLYDELTGDGTEYVGIFMLGENFTPVWVGNAVSLKDGTKWGRQNTPTVIQVSTGVLAGLCWMLENIDKPGIFYPEDLPVDYTLKLVEKYMGKTIYESVEREKFDAPVDYANIKYKQFIVEK